MTNLAGQDMEAVLEAFHAVQDDAPRCFIAYTIKGFGTPLAGHKDNHAGLMTPDQMARFKSENGIRSEEHTSELQSLMRISYAVFCLKKKKEHKTTTNYIYARVNKQEQRNH